MRPSPTVDESHRSTKESSALTIAAAAIRLPRTVRCPRSASAMAPSMISRKSSGGTTPSSAEATTATRKPATIALYGRAKPHTLRRVSGPIRPGVGRGWAMVWRIPIGVVTLRAYGGAQWRGRLGR